MGRVAVVITVLLLGCGVDRSHVPGPMDGGPGDGSSSIGRDGATPITSPVTGGPMAGPGGGPGTVPPPPPMGPLPELGGASPTFTMIANAEQGMHIPRDLEFNPAHPDQLWVAQADTYGVTILFDVGTSEQRSDERTDLHAYHFMDTVSSIAFAPNDRFASCQESYNHDGEHANMAVGAFMGPTLWDGDLNVFARVNQGDEDMLLGSHIDMLHESPLCMGIAHEGDNRYWVFDGANEQLVFYDFRIDHGPGHDDHSDGVVRRYPEVSLARVPNVPGHLVFDQDTGLVYVADTGDGTVLRVDPRPAQVAETLEQDIEPLAEYSRMEGAIVETFARGLSEPSGLAIRDGRVYVSNHGTGEIVAFDGAGREIGRVDTGEPGIMGITFGPDGRLYFANGLSNVVARIDGG